MKIAIIMFLSIVITITYIRQIKNHSRTLRQCILFIENISILIKYKNLTIDEILYSLISSNNYNMLTFLTGIDGNDNNYYEKINSYFNENRIIKGFDSEDIENLKGFISMLGKSDTEGQIMNCELYKKILEQKLKKLTENENMRCKSATAITMGFGFLLSIIFI